jgi:hypothetical protein
VDRPAHHRIDSKNPSTGVKIMTSAKQSIVKNVSVSLCVIIMAMMVLAAMIVAAVAATAGAAVVAVTAVWTIRLSAV